MTIRVGNIKKTESIKKNSIYSVDNKTGYVFPCSDFLTPDEEKILFQELQKAKEELLNFFIRSDYFVRYVFNRCKNSRTSIAMSLFSKKHDRETKISYIKTFSDLLKKNNRDFSSFFTLSDQEQQFLLNVLRSRTEKGAECLKTLGIKAMCIFDKERVKLFNLLEEVKLYNSADEKDHEQQKRIKEIEALFNLPIREVEEYLTNFQRLANIFLEKRDRIIIANYRLIVSFAKKYKTNGADLLDFIQEGQLALIKAINCFNSSLKNRFSTYACTVLHACYIEYESAKFFKRTTYRCYYAHIKKIRRSFNKLRGFLQREPLLEEVSRDTDIPEKIVKKLLPFLILSKSIDDLDPATLNATLMNTKFRNGDDNVFAEEYNYKKIQQILRQAMAIVDTKLKCKFLRDDETPSEIYIKYRGLFGQEKVQLGEIMKLYRFNCRASLTNMLRRYEEKLKYVLLLYDNSRKLVDLLPWIHESLDENLN